MFIQTAGVTTQTVVIPDNSTTKTAYTITCDVNSRAGKVAAAYVANATYLAIPSPTTAQAVAQVAALTQAIQFLARLLIDQLDTNN